MPYLLGIAVVAGVSFGAIVFRDPDAIVRAWAVVGMGVAFVALAIAVCNVATRDR